MDVRCAVIHFHPDLVRQRYTLSGSRPSIGALIVFPRAQAKVEEEK